MQLETIIIEKIVNGGYGLGLLPSGQVVLVRHVLPGEKVQVTVTQKKKNLLIARLEEILVAHPQRRRPPCPYAGECGGCDLQHVDYPLQLSIKKAIVGDLLARGPACLAEVASRLADPIAAPQELHYRQRLRLQVDDRGRLGFHRHQSHTVTPVSSCLLGSRLQNRVLHLLGSDPAAKKLLALSAEVEILENPGSLRAVVIFHLRRKPRPADLAAAKALENGISELEGIYLRGEGFPFLGPFANQEAPDTKTGLGLSYPPTSLLSQGLRLRWEIGGFCQVNLDQNRVLIDKVLDFCQAKPGIRLLDLYCGMGNFSIPLALQGAEVLGIEGQASAIRSAIANAKGYPAITARFQQNPIHLACATLVAAGEVFDCLVIDPPRAGAPDLADHLNRLCGNRLIYISCDPATLCRDLGQLQQRGFAISKLQPIDMFPQTHHIETVALLEK